MIVMRIDHAYDMIVHLKKNVVPEAQQSFLLKKLCFSTIEILVNHAYGMIVFCEGITSIA